MTCLLGIAALLAIHGRGACSPMLLPLCMYHTLFCTFECLHHAELVKTGRKHVCSAWRLKWNHKSVTWILKKRNMHVPLQKAHALVHCSASCACAFW
jgi:hypothetical protein